MRQFKVNKVPVWPVAEIPRQRSWGSVVEAFVRHRDRKYAFDTDGRMQRRHVLVRRNRIIGLGKATTSSLAECSGPHGSAGM